MNNEEIQKGLKLEGKEREYYFRSFVKIGETKDEI